MVVSPENITKTQHITSQIELTPPEVEYDVHDAASYWYVHDIASRSQLLDFDEELGFVSSQIFTGLGETDLIGFTGNRQAHKREPRGSISSITELDGLQEHERTIAMQSRGVGTRMYNTPQALLGTGEGASIDAYLFRVEPSKIVDLRHGSRWGRATQLAQQVGRKVRSEIQGVEKTVEGIHKSFGPANNVDAVLYDQSRTMREQQAEARIEQFEGIEPVFMIIRNPYILIHKIGTLKSE